MKAKVQIQIPPKTSLADCLPQEVGATVARTIFEVNGNPERLQVTEDELRLVARQAAQTAINSVIAVIGGNTNPNSRSH